MGTNTQRASEPRNAIINRIEQIVESSNLITSTKTQYCTQDLSWRIHILVAKFVSLMAWMPHLVVLAGSSKSWAELEKEKWKWYHRSGDEAESAVRPATSQTHDHCRFVSIHRRCVLEMG